MGFKAFCKRTGVVIYKHRADIEFVAGLGLVITGTTMLIKDSEKIATAFNDHSVRMKEIEDFDAADAEDPGAGWIDENERKSFVRADIKCTVKDLSKTVGKGVAVVAAGEILQGISHMSLNRQLANATLLAANLSTAYANLKKKIVEDQGQEKLDEYLYGPQIKKVVVDEDGNVTETTELITDNNKNLNLPPHCFFFDESSRIYSKSRGVNRDTVHNIRMWLDQRLGIEGFLFENDIRREFQLPLVECGWTSGIMAYDKDGNRNHLSFGLENAKKGSADQRFLDGDEPTVLIKLNLEDDILSQLHLFKY